jgi:lipid II:glycine glycyltransferase (peptidoglycan interpeptide bridge formation enzyme)
VTDVAIETFISTSLKEEQVSRWRAFLESLSGGHYAQDPAWAIVEGQLSAKRPHHAVFSWSEDDGSLRLTAAGVRRDSPIPGWGYYDFLRGPAFERAESLETWVDQVVPLLRGDALVLRLSPYLRLDSGGDRVESILRTHDFVRDTRLGTWGTLETDLTRAESELWESFPPRTRRGIRRGQRAGIEVRSEDNSEGWRAFVDMHREMSLRSGMTPFSLGDLEVLSRHWLRGGSGGTVLVARISGVPVAACVLLVYQDVAYYLAAGSTRAQGGLPVSYVLAWEVITWAQSQGCRAVDWCGYSLTARPGDPLWGTNVFKSYFSGGAGPLLYCAAHERVLAPSRYTIARLARRANGLVRRAGGRR